MGRSINTSSTNRHIDSKTKRSQSKYRHTMKFTGLIASTMILLVIVMASTASARAIAFPAPQNCCQAISAKCEACKAGVSEDEFCITNPHSRVCPMKPSHPDNCYSTIWNTEVLHGEMGARKCCWLGDWKHKSKCNGGHNG